MRERDRERGEIVKNNINNNNNINEDVNNNDENRGLTDEHCLYVRSGSPGRGVCSIP